jgi:hypothetical protein
MWQLSPLTEHNQLQFLHVACFSPVPPTWTDINQGVFTTWLRVCMLAARIRKWLPKSIATANGHLDQGHKNQQSTKLEPPETNGFPAMGAGQRHNIVFATISDTRTWRGQAYQDLTGQFPTTSSHGMQ